MHSLVVRVESLIDGRSTLDSGVNVAKIELFVEHQEKLIILDVRGDFFGFGPWRRFEVFFRQFRPTVFVQICHFVTVSLVDHVAEVAEEPLDSVGNEVGVLTAVAAVVLAIEHRVAGMATVLVVIILQKEKQGCKSRPLPAILGANFRQYFPNKNNNKVTCRLRGTTASRLKMSVQKRALFPAEKK